MADNQGRGSNLTEEDRKRGGEHSHSGSRSSSQDEQTNMDIGQEGSSQGRGSGGHRWNSEEAADAGHKGGSK